MTEAAALDLDRHLPGIAAGDTRAFAAWMAGAEPVLRHGLRRFAAAVDTEAVLQETLLRVWQVAPRFVPDGRPDGLLRLGHTIARNLCVDELRRRRPTAVDPAVMARGIDEAEQVEPRPPDPMLRRIIALCRDKLPARPAQALAARIEAGGARPDAALAAALEMSHNAFLQNITRARKLLAGCLKKNGVELRGPA